jgi:hypothetical protein
MVGDEAQPLPVSTGPRRSDREPPTKPKRDREVRFRGNGGHLHRGRQLCLPAGVACPRGSEIAEDPALTWVCDQHDVRRQRSPRAHHLRRRPADALLPRSILRTFKSPGPPGWCDRRSQRVPRDAICQLEHLSGSDDDARPVRRPSSTTEQSRNGAIEEPSKSIES